MSESAVISKNAVTSVQEQIIDYLFDGFEIGGMDHQLFASKQGFRSTA